MKTNDIKAVIGLNYLLEQYLKNNPSEVNKFAASMLSEAAKDIYEDKYDSEMDSFKSDYADYINAKSDDFLNSTEKYGNSGIDSSFFNDKNEFPTDEMNHCIK